MKYLLDSDTLTLYQTGHATVVRNILSRPACDLALTVISVEEQLTGWYARLRRCKKPDELARIYLFLTNSIQSLARFKVVTFSESAILRAGALKKQGLNVGKKDLGIAAIALEHAVTVVTRNRIDFQRVPGLNIEDWSQ